MSEQVTYEEANPFSTSADDLADLEPSERSEKTWHKAMEGYGATKIDESVVKWEFEKTEDNIAKTDPHADLGDTTVEVTVEMVEFTKKNGDGEEEDVPVMRSEFRFTAEIIKEGVTVTGTTEGPLEALFKVLETAQRYDFHHYFETDVPEHIKNQIFKDEVQSREWAYFGTGKGNE